MGDILESGVEYHLGDRLVPVAAEEGGRIFQAFLKEPSSGRIAEVLAEIPFEGREAPVTEPRELLEG